MQETIETISRVILNLMIIVMAILMTCKVGIWAFNLDASENVSQPASHEIIRHNVAIYRSVFEKCVHDSPQSVDECDVAAYDISKEVVSEPVVQPEPSSK